MPRLHSAHLHGSEQRSKHKSGQHEYVSTSLALIILLILLPPTAVNWAERAAT